MIAFLGLSLLLLTFVQQASAYHAKDAMSLPHEPAVPPLSSLFLYNGIVAVFSTQRA